MAYIYIYVHAGIAGLNEFDRYYLFIAACLPAPVTVGIPRTGAYVRMQLVPEQPRIVSESISKSVSVANPSSDAPFSQGRTRLSLVDTVVSSSVQTGRQLGTRSSKLAPPPTMNPFRECRLRCSASDKEATLSSVGPSLFEVAPFKLNYGHA